MTILNIALDDSRVFIAVDTAVSKDGQGRIGDTSKLLTLPSIRCAVAGHGSATALSQFHCYAAHLSDARTVGELIAESRDVLHTIWNASELEEVRAHAIGFGVLVAGIEDGGAKATYFHSRDDFAPRHYTRGVILSPMPEKLRELEEADAAEESPSSDTPSSVQVVPRVSWADLVQVCTKFAREQQADAQPGSIGGRLWGTLITSNSIFQSEIIDLDEPVP